MYIQSKLAAEHTHKHTHNIPGAYLKFACSIFLKLGIFFFFYVCKVSYFNIFLSMQCVCDHSVVMILEAILQIKFQVITCGKNNVSVLAFVRDFSVRGI